MTTTLVSVETRKVVRCDSCSLIQYKTTNSLCRRCKKPLDIEEPTTAALSAGAGWQVAEQVRHIRKAQHLSQQQLAKRMEVPRTYITKIENGKAIPALGSLERLAAALDVDISQLVRDARSIRYAEVAAIFADPFLAEIAALLPRLETTHRMVFHGAVRDAAMGRHRAA